MLNSCLVGYAFGRKVNSDGTSLIQKQIIVYGIGPLKVLFSTTTTNGSDNDVTMVQLVFYSTKNRFKYSLVQLTPFCYPLDGVRRLVVAYSGR